MMYINPLKISTTSLPAGATGTAYSTALEPAGGAPHYSWSVSNGALPSGLALSAGGTISGTPTKSGSYSFSAQVKDVSGLSATYTYSTAIAAGTTQIIEGGGVLSPLRFRLEPAGATSARLWPRRANVTTWLSRSCTNWPTVWLGRPFKPSVREAAGFEI